MNYAHDPIISPLATVGKSNPKPFSSIPFPVIMSTRLATLIAHMVSNMQGPVRGMSHDQKWDIWGFPKIRGTILGVPIIRTIIYWGLYWGPLILGNYHFILRERKFRQELCPKDG